MTFDFNLLLRILKRFFSDTLKNPSSLSIKRLLVTLFLFVSYPLVEAVNWFCFLLDEIFFPGYRDIKISEPVFIIGIPRSGTTFLHRLLSRDSDQFTSVKLWEILFAPSIVQKKIFLLISKLAGSRITELVMDIESWCFKKFGSMHKISLFEPEEDEMLLIHVFATIFLISAFPFAEELQPYVKFDEILPRDYRFRVMKFYKRCVQKHLFVFGQEKRFLSKNPMFIPKTETLQAIMPDAKIICTVRTPFETLPSEISILSEFFDAFGIPKDLYPLQGMLYGAMAYWYRYPLRQLPFWPKHSCMSVKYKDLTTDPSATVRNIYYGLGLNISESFQLILNRETEKSRTYKSTHSYCLEKLGMSRKKITEDFRDILEHFGFDPEN